MIIPINISFDEWSNQMLLDLQQYGNIPLPSGLANWREWAQSLLLVPGISVYNPPEPVLSDSWVDWAQRFIGVFR